MDVIASAEVKAGSSESETLVAHSLSMITGNAVLTLVTGNVLVKRGVTRQAITACRQRV